MSTSSSAVQDRSPVPTSPKMSSRARRAPPPSSSGLKIPSLPRFHPANYTSPSSTGVANTPTSGINSPQAPVSPRSQQRQYSEAQMQLFTHHRELLAASRTPGGGKKPDSPKLQPLAGSPGPVTPLELEGAKGGDYLMSGPGSSGPASAQSQKDYVDRLIRKERGDISPRSATKC